MVVFPVCMTVQLIAADFHILYGNARFPQQLPASLVEGGHRTYLVLFVNNEGNSFVRCEGNLSYEAGRSAKARKDNAMVIPLKLLQSLGYCHSHVSSSCFCNYNHWQPRILEVKPRAQLAEPFFGKLD